MSVLQKIREIESQLVRLERGREYERHVNMRRRGESRLTRVYKAHYLPNEVWESLDERARLLVRMLALRRVAVREPIFSHTSAAVLLGLPLYKPTGEAVHLTTPPECSNRAGAWVIRHRSVIDPRDTVLVAGLRCTSPERTILDLARSGASEDALSCADAHLRNEFRVDRKIDAARLEEWRDRMAERLRALNGGRGVRLAREVLAAADPRKDSVLESVSHLRLDRLGFRVALQVPVAGPNGYDYFVDFELLGLRLFGECDGKMKYTDEGVLGGRTANEQVYRDKRRQDWICGTRNYGMIRWGYPDVDTELTFARRLVAFGVDIPKPPRGLLA